MWAAVVCSVSNSTFCRCRTAKSCCLWHKKPWGGRVVQLPTSLLEDFPMLSVKFSYWSGMLKDYPYKMLFLKHHSYIIVLINDCSYLEALRKEKASASCKIYMFSLCVDPPLLEVKFSKLVCLFVLFSLLKCTIFQGGAQFVPVSLRTSTCTFISFLVLNCAKHW